MTAGPASARRSDRAEAARLDQRTVRLSRPDGAASQGRPVLWALGLGALAFVLRAVGLRSANDVFIDEITYASLADQVAHGHLPSTSGDPFFLHPPASFVLNAVVERVFGFTGDAMDLALQLRWTNAVLGAASVVVAYLLVRRLAGAVPAALAGLVLVVDPFALRMDGRVMIETPAGLAVLTGWLLVLRALDREPGPARTRGELLAGLVFGIALVTKDMTGAFTVLPLLLAGLWRRTLPAAVLRRILPAIAVPYVGYLGLITVLGQLPAFADQKLVGVLRMVGVVQETGFNAGPNADLASRLVEMVGRFGTSYALLALCPLAGLVAALSAVPARRLVGLVALCAGLLGVYCVVGGAAEEQFGYYVVLAAVVAAPVALLELVERRPGLRRPLIGLTALFCAAAVALGVQARLTTDDGLAQARAWAAGSPAATGRVGLTSVTAEFALLPHEGWGVWPSLASLDAEGAQYVLTQSHPLSQGYGFADPRLLDWLAANAVPVFTATGPTSGRTVVWQLDPAALDAAVAAGTTLPPVTGGYP
jgi:4-amino-4-deoxy-L-arabinose transferase-like glycosyltransferase